MLFQNKNRVQAKEKTPALTEVFSLSLGNCFHPLTPYTIMGAGSGSNDTMDAANILKPVLARGGLQVIGATTRKEYCQHVEGCGI